MSVKWWRHSFGVQTDILLQKTHTQHTQKSMQAVTKLWFQPFVVLDCWPCWLLLTTSWSKTCSAVVMLSSPSRCYQEGDCSDALHCSDGSLVVMLLFFPYSDFDNCVFQLVRHFWLTVFPNSGICASQIHVACRDGKVDQALSLGLLLCWIAGDLTNLIGCYLTNQLPIQVICQHCYFLIYPFFQNVCLNSKIL